MWCVMRTSQGRRREAAFDRERAPKDASVRSVESASVLLRLLTPENRDLLKMIRDKKPRSVAELARLAKRASPNLLRTLGKFEALGLIEMRRVGKMTMPVPLVHKLHVEIDPYSSDDRFEIA